MLSGCLANAKQMLSQNRIEENSIEEYRVEENNIIPPPCEQSSSGDIAKASKHKYGEYKHVLLKDEELQALKRDYSNWEELIKYLDEYIEMKGYKAKSHYLCIRKWVVKAVEEHSAQSRLKAKKGATFGDLLREEYGEDDQKRDNASDAFNTTIISEVLSEYDTR